MRNRKSTYIGTIILGMGVLFITPWVGESIMVMNANVGERLSIIPQGVRAWWRFPRLEKENAELQLRLVRALSDSAKITTLENENTQLRALVHVPHSSVIELVPASVIARAPSALGRMISISMGSNQGIHEGLAVLSSDGVLIGTIREVNSHRATVLLITDPLSKIAGISSSNVEGIVSGTTGASLSFDFVPAGAPLHKGEVITTSGIDENIPSGLVVGQIRNISTDTQGLLLTVDALPAFDRLRLQFVVVVKKQL